MSPPADQSLVHVPPEALTAYLYDICRKLDMSESHARLLADLLVLTDLRGLSTHGSRMMAYYVQLFRRGYLNPRPRLREHSHAPSTVMVDGGGGLGHFSAHRAAHLLVDMAREQGIAAALTHNHGHIGAAGLYCRIPARHDLVCYGTSGYHVGSALEPARSILDAGGASPVTFAIPGGTEHPIVLDFGTIIRDPEKMFSLAPDLTLRSFGLGVICQVLGGILAGVPITSDEARPGFQGATQGALFIALDIARFADPAAFRAQVDDYVRRAAAMRPLPGHERAHLPGGPEWECERQYTETGIPFASQALARLAAVGQELGLSTPTWAVAEA